MPDTAIDWPFGDATYRFWLPMARIIEIEANRGGKSIVTMYEELSEGIQYSEGSDDPTFHGLGSAHIADVAEIIRCAAIGGNARIDGEDERPVSPTEAKRLIELYVSGRPMAESVPTAWMILKAAILGVTLKKKAQPEADNLSHTEKAT